MPLDDLTGDWMDNQGHVRRVSSCAHRPGVDVWHVTHPEFNSHTRHYDGDTIRIEWTLDPTSRKASA